MAKRVQVLGFLQAAIATLTGRDRELIVNTTRYSLTVHDGTTPGGHEMAKADMSNAEAASVSQQGAMTGAMVLQLNQATTDLSALTVVVTAQGVRLDTAEDDIVDLVAADTALDGRLDTAETKLATIETNADVTDSVNVSAAGALMKVDNLAGLNSKPTSRQNLGMRLTVAKGGSSDGTDFTVVVDGTTLEIDATVGVRVKNGGLTAAKLAAATRGDMLVAGVAGAWGPLALGTAGQVVMSNGTDKINAFPNLGRKYDSGAITYTNGSTVAPVAHNLGGVPEHRCVLLTCVDAGGDAGFVQNESTFVEGVSVIGPDIRGVQFRVTTTTIGIDIAPSGIAVVTAGGIVALTASKWEMRILAWR